MSLTARLAVRALPRRAMSTASTAPFHLDEAKSFVSLPNASPRRCRPNQARDHGPASFGARSLRAQAVRRRRGRGASDPALTRSAVSRHPRRSSPLSATAATTT